MKRWSISSRGSVEEWEHTQIGKYEILVYVYIAKDIHNQSIHFLSTKHIPVNYPITHTTLYCYNAHMYEPITSCKVVSTTVLSGRYFVHSKPSCLPGNSGVDCVTKYATEPPSDMREVWSLRALNSERDGEMQ